MEETCGRRLRRGRETRAERWGTRMSSRIWGHATFDFGGDVMPDYDAGFKIAANVSGRQLAEVGGVEASHWEPLVGEVQTTTRFADRAFKACYSREWFIVYMEAYTRWASAAPWSVLAKSGLLSERERLPTLSLVYVLLPRGYQPQQGKLWLNALGKPTQQVWFREICLWRVKPRPWWEQAPGLMTLYPLCDHGRDQVQAITYAARSISVGLQDTATRADLLTTLAIFGKLVYPGMNVLDVIGREKMKESKFYEEVMAEGRIEKGREVIVDALHVRFGPDASAEFRDVLAAVEDEQVLSELLRLAITARRFVQFRRQAESILTPARA
jgi:hypothetical protein